MRVSDFTLICVLSCVASLGCQRVRTLSEISEPSKSFDVTEITLDGKIQPHATEKLNLFSGTTHAFSLLLTRREGHTSAESGTIALMKPEQDYFVTVQSATFRGEKKVGNKIKFEFSLRIPTGQSGDALLQIRDDKNSMIAELSCTLISDQ
ncbi:MAG: hypothetical protein SFV81_07315 [Pirellulaceae bacterium]|nr:hypothetical protein [Pirellulaceae bacterium]